MKKFPLFLFIHFLCSLHFLFSQGIFPDQNTFKADLELYDLKDKQKYGALRHSTENRTSKTLPLLSQQKNLFLKALAAYELLNNDALFLLKEFTRLFSESMYYNEAIYFTGNVFYREKKWKNAIEEYEKVDVKNLDDDQQIAYHFKLGYAYFNLKNYDQARPHFLAIKDKPSLYQNHATYYYSHIHYEENKYETALKGFMTLTNDSFYAPIVPFYIAQIYFNQKKYDELITLSSSLFDKSQPKRKEEIAKMLLFAFSEKKDYANAMNYANFLDQQKSNLTREENYLIAYAYYANKQYDKAIEYFTKVQKKEDSLSQYAAYHLGHCYVMTGQKKYALNSFYEAYQIDKDPTVQEDAMFHFVKLSYELDYYPFNSATKVLQNYIEKYPNSPRAEKAKEWLARILVSTGNYAEAIEVIKKIKLRSPEINIAYQKANLNMGFQQYNQQNYSAALACFTEVLKNNFERTYYAKALYWSGEALFILQKYDSAYDYFQRFVQYPASERVEEYAHGYYSLGYTQIKLQKYNDAIHSFKTFLNLAKNETNSLLIDAQIRLADCYYKQKNIDDALKNYESVYKKKSEQADYALYQMAIIQGVQGNLIGKINSLQLLIDNFKNSSLRPLAMYEQALAYELSNQSEKAIQVHQLLISQYPNHGIKLSSLIKIGFLYRNSNQNDKAIEVLKKIIEEYPSTEESRQAWVMLKNIYTEMDQLNAFFDYVAQKGATVSDQEKDSLLYQSAENKFMEGDCDGAIRGFTTYLNQFPAGNNSTSAHFYRAECLYGQKKFQEALSDYEAVIKVPISSFKEKALLKAARIYYNLTNYEKAVEYYSTLEKIGTTPQVIFEAQKNMLNALFTMGKYAESIEYAEKIKQSPQASKPDINTATIMAARANIELNNYDKAKELLAPLTKEKGSETGAIATYYMAFIQYKQNAFTDAENTVFDLINKYPSYEEWVARGFILLGDIYTATGNYYQAKFAYQSVIDNYEGEELVKEAQQKLNNVIELEKNQQ